MFGRDCAVELKSFRAEEPLTLTLSRRERGLTEVFGFYAST
jgi:hypothetical protein